MRSFAIMKYDNDYQFDDVYVERIRVHSFCYAAVAIAIITR